jgi:GT2 family glycosyltransferase
MKLSIVIVNYNVKYFLEHCLQSVFRALNGFDAEVFVVDNASSDDSVTMLKERFPEVKLICNQENLGFSKANNQAIMASKGEYVLLLNPDTVVQNDTFKKCLDFMDAHPEAGGLGVTMIDGSGKYLPESKRGFPSPWVAFCKAFGLTAIFPKSKMFAGYYLGHLHKDQTHEVDVLAGAYMLMRRDALNKTGLLDENFFMYGEDIDLSYRIVKAGYKNYYLSTTRIIHYKGESTKKGSLNYVRMFYQAMIIFARKHFGGTKAGPLIFIIQCAIYARAILTLLSNLFRSMGWPIADAIFLYGGMMLIKNFWEQNIKLSEGITYPPTFTLLVVPVYIIIWLVSIYFSGGYDKPVKLSRILRGLVTGTIIIAALYGFIDESLRFSRAMILLGFGYGTVVLIANRLIFHLVKHGNIDIEQLRQKRVVVAGSFPEYKRVLNLVTLSRAHVNVLGYIDVPKNYDLQQEPEGCLGNLTDIRDIIDLYNIDEIIFCTSDIGAEKIIDLMSTLGSGIEYKIVPKESESIIGSHSKNMQGELYTLDIQLNINTPHERRNKRVFDIAVSLALLPLWFILFWNFEKPLGVWRNIFLVLSGKKSWVGYALSGVANTYDMLPKVRSGILSPLTPFRQNHRDADTIARMNLLYARDYTVYKDLEIIYKGFKDLGNG